MVHKRGKGFILEKQAQRRFYISLMWSQAPILIFFSAFVVWLVFCCMGCFGRLFCLWVNYNQQFTALLDSDMVVLKKRFRV